MTIVGEVVVFSSMNWHLHLIAEVVTGTGEELKARNQTKTMPYRVSNQTVGTVGQLARGGRSRFQQDPSVGRRQRIYIGGDAQHATLSRLSESVKQSRCTVSWAGVDCRSLCSQEIDLHTPSRKCKAVCSAGRQWWLRMRTDVGEAVAVNGEVRVGTTQKQGVATLTVGAKADHRGPMFHNRRPVRPS
jgi:hypothetical protein